MEAKRINPNMIINKPTKGKIFDHRSANAIHERFKMISQKATKLYGVEKTTDRTSVFDNEKYTQ